MTYPRLNFLFKLLLSFLFILNVKCRLPNIVVFIADDLGIGDLGCYGNDTIRTPNIDKMAKNGAKLTHHLAASSLCSPSRAALLTGRHPIRLGLMGNNLIPVIISLSCTAGLAPEEITLAELVKSLNYSTALIGKWHLGLNCKQYGDFCHHPLKQGFDYFYGLPLTNFRNFDEAYSIDQASKRNPKFWPAFYAYSIGTFVTIFVLLWLKTIKVLKAMFLLILIMAPAIVVGYFFWHFAHIREREGIVMRNFDIVQQPVDLTNFTHRLLHEVNNYLNQRYQDNQPFLLVVSWIQVHTALHASALHRGKSVHGRYGDEVEEMDWSIGQVLKTLDKLGMTDNTFVYMTSDNGGHVEERLYNEFGPQGGWNGIYSGGKAQGAMDGGIRVPGVMMWPNHIRPGTIINHPTSLMDLFPTVASIIGVSPPSDKVYDGQNLLPLITNQTEAPSDRHFVHYCTDQIHAARYSEANGAVWKVRYATPNWLSGTEGCEYLCDCHGASVTLHDPPLLFNMNEDPSEKYPLNGLLPANDAIIKRINTSVSNFVLSVEDRVSQSDIWSMLPRPWLQPCCNPPHCVCREPDISLVLD